MKKIGLILVGILAGLVLKSGVLGPSDSDILAAAQKGELRLTCLMQDGERTIDPTMIVDLIEGTWVFENGGARQCRTEQVAK